MYVGSAFLPIKQIFFKSSVVYMLSGTSSSRFVVNKALEMLWLNLRYHRGTGLEGLSKSI